MKSNYIYFTTFSLNSHRMMTCPIFLCFQFRFPQKGDLSYICIGNRIQRTKLFTILKDSHAANKSRKIDKLATQRGGRPVRIIVFAIYCSENYKLHVYWTKITSIIHLVSFFRYGKQCYKWCIKFNATCHICFIRAYITETETSQRDTNNSQLCLYVHLQRRFLNSCRIE